jgi:hypothetical protein
MERGESGEVNQDASGSVQVSPSFEEKVSY